MSSLNSICHSIESKLLRNGVVVITDYRRISELFLQLTSQWMKYNEVILCPKFVGREGTMSYDLDIPVLYLLSPKLQGRFNNYYKETLSLPSFLKVE